MSDTKVSTEEMVAAIDDAHCQVSELGRNWKPATPDAVDFKKCAKRLRAASDYILAARSDLTTIRAAVEARDDETTGDAVARVLLDRRAEIAELHEVIESHDREQAEVENLRYEIAEMRKVTGPKCPKCGHWLKAEHAYTTMVAPSYTPGYVRYDSGSPCRITVAEILRDHPDIAAELGLAKGGT